jgi:UDP-N-acetylmuramoylalanine--D-glutamate ligase
MKHTTWEIKDKKVLVVGLGKSGIAAAQALVNRGARVSVQDAKSPEEIEAQLITYLQNEKVTCYFASVPKDPASFDLIILSPGVSLDLPFVREASAKGVWIAGELELAYQLGPGHYIAITGTNGKTTTTTLVGEMFKSANRDTAVVGNIGVAVTTKAIQATENTWMITEVSSFQLETIRHFHPQVSAILNLTPDHLDRHKTMEEYGRVKARIFENQKSSDFLIINFDDKPCYQLAKHAKATVVPFSRLQELSFGAFVMEADGMITIRDQAGVETQFCHKDELMIPGTHNLENALAATAIAYFSGISADVIRRTLREFAGVEHRIEFVNEIDGIRFVNDSKGTNSDAAIKAIEAIPAPIFLIAGGYDKGSDFSELIDAFPGKVEMAFLMGKTASKIKEAAESKGFTKTIILKDMDACVREAFRQAKPGTTVLLSPACASWDMYDNFEQRGRHFKDCVAGLEK